MSGGAGPRRGRAAAADPELDAAIAAALEAFDAMGPVRARRMFGGAGLYLDGLMFALIADGQVWLKAGADNAPAFDAEGLPHFVYAPPGSGRSISMSYRLMPERAFDDPDEAAHWGGLGFAAARRAAAAKRDRPRRR